MDNLDLMRDWLGGGVLLANDLRRLRVQIIHRMLRCGIDRAVGRVRDLDLAPSAKMQLVVLARQVQNLLRLLIGGQT